MSACLHGMPTPGSCVECMDEGNIPPAPAPPTLEAIGPPFYARHAAQCPSCNLPIHVHQIIVKMSNDTYWHARCAP